ncbi:Asp-tRNA(Asn)/Glu-tRNA(Gln) amidotransferase subunit GatC [Desulfonatronovibrio hydrogenovorans]|uniref:Asp-tRNA(Asn)/Glu-tRNA(Gln) amidotransferase subunit GatC n=1 Tax=Desulfonatronovibrio hydrogenovorans TaxID=53245 RepID=UPI00048B8627|nr:Asp-tRNA(Asn)/Glu-tRNA(Gln) amidotransferase subunit GatC [Desulfonatronovibrio hydrogenovorans]
MEITQKQVAKIAALARLDLDEQSLEKFAHQFSEIIAYMDKMNTLDTSGVDPLYSPSENTSVLREDSVQKEYQREDLLANAPAKDEKFFIVPKIL